MELPRYVRINTLKTTLERTIEHFQSKGYEVIELPDRNKREKMEKERVFWQDEHLNDIIVFPSGTDLHDDEWVTEGKLILQDKASCLSAIVLMEDCQPADSIENASPFLFCDAIDACAAPGNKTTHAAALMSREDHQYSLIAVDKDNKRIILLRQFTERAGAKVDIKHQSFLDIESDDPSTSNVSKIPHV